VVHYQPDRSTTREWKPSYSSAVSREPSLRPHVHAFRCLLRLRSRLTASASSRPSAQGPREGAVRQFGRTASGRAWRSHSPAWSHFRHSSSRPCNADRGVLSHVHSQRLWSHGRGPRTGPPWFGAFVSLPYFPGPARAGASQPCRLRTPAGAEACQPVKLRASCPQHRSAAATAHTPLAGRVASKAAIAAWRKSSVASHTAALLDSSNTGCRGQVIVQYLAASQAGPVCPCRAPAGSGSAAYRLWPARHSLSRNVFRRFSPAAARAARARLQRPPRADSACGSAKAPPAPAPPPNRQPRSESSARDTSQKWAPYGLIGDA